jgi:hypothetical protein
MPTHDIIDNRSEKLVDHINRILPPTSYKKGIEGKLQIRKLLKPQCSALAKRS